jgi:hypothetical protein
MTVFDDIDRAAWHIGPWGPEAITSPKDVRGKVLILTILAGILWTLLGWDSSWEMMRPVEIMLFSNPLGVVPALLNAGSQLRADMWAQYGVGDHWSAFVIYGAAFLVLSKHLEGQGVGGSLNFFACSSITLLNVGCFEYTYNYVYSVAQGQGWAFSLMNKNILMFTAFIALGVFFLLFLWEQGYRVVDRWWTLGSVVLAFAAFYLWFNYPFPVVQATAVTQWGTWVSSPHFPQTYYAVQNGVNSFVPVYVGNDLLHGVNTLTKALFTFALLGVTMLVKAKDV